MYARIRKLDKLMMQPGTECLVLATTRNSQKGTIDLNPCVLEWWDGIDWHAVPIVDKDSKEDPV